MIIDFIIKSNGDDIPSETHLLHNNSLGFKRNPDLSIIIQILEGNSSNSTFKVKFWEENTSFECSYCSIKGNTPSELVSKDPYHCVESVNQIVI